MNCLAGWWLAGCSREHAERREREELMQQQAPFPSRCRLHSSASGMQIKREPGVQQTAEGREGAHTRGGEGNPRRCSLCGRTERFFNVLCNLRCAGCIMHRSGGCLWFVFYVALDWFSFYAAGVRTRIELLYGVDRKIIWEYTGESSSDCSKSRWIS